MKNWQTNLLTVGIAGVLSIGFMLLIPSPSLYMLMADMWALSLVLWAVIYLFTKSIKNAEKKKMIKDASSSAPHL
jgi:hypothetical protein